MDRTWGKTCTILLTLMVSFVRRAWWWEGLKKELKDSANPRIIDCHLFSADSARFEQEGFEQEGVEFQEQADSSTHVCLYARLPHERLKK